MIPSRLQTTADKAKALKQYEQLKRLNIVRRAIVIAELKDGSFHILGQELTPAEMAPLLVVAADALAQADEGRKIVKLVARIEPEKRGVWNGQRAGWKEITIAEDGTMTPPPGENFISCGECNHPHFFVLHFNRDDRTSRYACTHCGNEIKNRAGEPI